MPGILHPEAAARRFRYTDLAPRQELAPYVEHFWAVAWNLCGEEPYEQRILPYPSVNMTFKSGRSRIAGVPRGRFSEILEGEGRVFGVRFRPGGFRPFVAVSVSSFTDRFVPVDEVFGPAGRALSAAVLAGDDTAAADGLTEFLTRRIPDRPDEVVTVVTDLVARIASDPGISRVDDLAAGSGIGVRRVQRLFDEYVGVGPKWVIRRYRLHEAAARAEQGISVELRQLAADLGYTDQAHLSRDFTAIVGQPPGAYMRSNSRR